MFRKKTEGPSVEELQEKIEGLEAAARDDEARVAGAFEDQAQAEAELRKAREEVDRLADENHRLRTSVEALQEQRNDLERRYFALKEAIKASQTLLEPHLGD